MSSVAPHRTATAKSHSSKTGKPGVHHTSTSPSHHASVSHHPSTTTSASHHASVSHHPSTTTSASHHASVSHHPSTTASASHHASVSHHPSATTAPASHHLDQAQTRPGNPHRTTSQMDTKYVNMLLALDGIPRMHNLLASFFTWILLAGFVLFPGTFTSLQNINASTEVEQRLVKAVAHVPLFVIAWICCGIGAAGMCWLWWRWMRNYVWLVNRIFPLSTLSRPGLLNCLAGIISTLVNVFGVQHGEFTATSKSTIVVTSAGALVCGLLTLYYSLWKLKRVKKKHDEQIGKERAGTHGEGRVEMIKRKAGEKQPEVDEATKSWR